jgi:MFS family permease
MCFSTFMINMDTTVVNVALPSIQRGLHESSAALEWTINAYMLAFAALLVTGGRLGGLLGRRRMFLAGVALFGISSAAIGFSGSVLWLAAWRAAQGAGAAAMQPATMSILTNTFGEEERGRALGLLSGLSALGLAFGPVLGGVLVEQVSWQSIFFINVPFAFAAIVVTRLAALESRDESAGRRIDVLGVITISVTLGCLVLALMYGSTWGWGRRGSSLYLRSPAPASPRSSSPNAAADSRSSSSGCCARGATPRSRAALASCRRRR